MPGRLDRTQLVQLVEQGDIDTVLTVFPDTFGRLMGKRVVGNYFLDHVVEEGAHACIYLFTVDMEMEPLPGFKLTSWERGYGDMKLVPDMTTLRGRADRGGAAVDPQAPDRARRVAGLRRQDRRRARALLLQGVV